MNKPTKIFPQSHNIPLPKAVLAANQTAPCESPTQQSRKKGVRQAAHQAAPSRRAYQRTTRMGYGH